MARYIDADALKDRLQNLAYDDWNQGASTTWAIAYGEVAEKVDDEPTADVVEVVRCADCKYLNEELAVGGWDGSCRYWNTHSVTYSWFCSQGERREGGTKQD